MQCERFHTRSHTRSEARLLRLRVWYCVVCTDSFLLILVAANIFIAILTDAYSQKKAQIVKYTRFKRLLRKEGVLLTSNSAAGLFKRIYRTFFPHWSLQLPPRLWPAPSKVGVTPVYKIHPFGSDGGADIVTLHFHHESIVGGTEAAADLTGASNGGEAGRTTTMRTQKQVGITLASAEQSDDDDDEDDEEQEQQPGQRPPTKKKAGVNATNALHGCRRACFLQLAQDLHMEGLPILITLMRPGEIVELKGTGRSTRSRIKLEMIEVFTRERTRKSKRGGEPEHSKDWFANFRVFDVKSWESFTKDKATQLLLDTNGWTAKQDDLIKENTRMKHEYDLARDAQLLNPNDTNKAVKRPQR